MSWSIFITAFVVGLSGAMMPGPLLTITINESGRRGFRAGPLVVLGHGLLELALVGGLALGLNRILGLRLVTGLIGLAGGAVLAWMGYGMAWGAWRGEVSLQVEGSGRRRGLGPVVAGVVASISNPYWVLWWATIGAAYVVASLASGVTGIASFYTGHVLADLAWYSFISLAVVTGRRYMGDRLYRGVLMACGLFLLALSLYFLYSGYRFVTGA